MSVCFPYSVLRETQFVKEISSFALLCFCAFPTIHLSKLLVKYQFNHIQDFMVCFQSDGKYFIDLISIYLHSNVDANFSLLSIFKSNLNFKKFQ